MTLKFSTPGTNKEFLSSILTFGNLVEYNETAVQSPTSESCGQYVVYAIINRLFNLDLEFSAVINEIFTLNLEDNEKRVMDFVKSL
jgi:hypothetical protein